MSCLSISADQRLDLNKLGPNDNDTVRGQIVGKKNNHAFLSVRGGHISFTSCAFYARCAYKKVQRVGEIQILCFFERF